MNLAAASLALLYLSLPLMSATTATAAAPPVPGPAPIDSLTTRWGPHPDRADSNTAIPRPPRDPAWQSVVLVPYYIIGLPLTLADRALKGTLLGLDRLGAFRTTKQVVSGLRDPLGNYWLPDIGYGDSQGWRFGFSVKRPDFPLPGLLTKFKYIASTTDASRWTLGSLLALREGSWLDFGGGSLVVSRDSFYGTGADTDQSDRAFYRSDSDWFGAGWREHFADGFEFVLVGHYSAVASSPGRHDGDRALDNVYAGDLPVGFGRTTAGVTGGVQLGFDDTSERGRPDHGTRFLVFTQFYEPTDASDTRFWTSGVSAERYFDLGYQQRNLALKGWFLREKSVAGSEIPFTRLINNRNPYQLRAYPTDRFSARGTTGISAEYRWPIWAQNKPEAAGVDAYLFGDAGQPFDHLADIAANNLFWSLGFGLRVINNRADYVLRFEVATGAEGTQVRLSTSQIFQFIKAGFYNGSDPVPVLR